MMRSSAVNTSTSGERSCRTATPDAPPSAGPPGPARRPGRGNPGPIVLLLALLATASGPLHGQASPDAGVAQARDRTWVCPPCAPHDTLRFEHDGTCPVCGMPLMETPDSSRIDDPRVHPGPGNFLVRGGPGHPDELIPVFYYRPRSHRPDSPVLLVLPGAGRDADEYRDAWIEAAEAHGVLVLSPMYREGGYDFGQYHMGGLMERMNLLESVREVEGSNEVFLDEEAFRYRVNRERASWIFRDFDRIVGMAKEAVGATRAGYDVFGHSAGGQIAHRMTLLARETDARRLVAGNSGFYTLPSLDVALPFGLENAPVERADLERALGRRLVVLIGEEDDEDETGGILLRSPTVDRQGAHRLARGRHFFERGRRRARELGVPFRWRLEIVPGVGHDFRAMSRAAAALLYGGTSDAGAALDGEADRDRRTPPRFPADAAYRVTAPFEPLAEHRTVRVPSSAGAGATVRLVGHVRVALPAGTNRLAVFRAGESRAGALWIPFRDATNGRETYEGGRYVPARRLEGGRLAVDFNRAYNPACAYRPGYACPLPPPGNRLSFPVPAGEKKPAGQNKPGSETRPGAGGVPAAAGLSRGAPGR